MYLHMDLCKILSDRNSSIHEQSNDIAAALSLLKLFIFQNQ